MTTKKKICEWVEDSDGTYQTTCGKEFQFIDSGCKENGFKFCCFCGKPLLEDKFEEKSGD